MSNSKIRRMETLLVIAIFALSSASMSWLLWRFPIAGAVAAAGILLFFGILAHLSRWSDTDLVSVVVDRSKRAQPSVSSLQLHP